MNEEIYSEELYTVDINKHMNGEVINGIFLVKSCKKELTKAQKPFLNIVLNNINGDINCKIWDFTNKTYELFTNNNIFGIKATVDEFMGNKQLIINKYKCIDYSNVKIDKLIKSSKFNINEIYDYIYNTATDFKNKTLNLIVTTILEDSKEEFIKFGASKLHHHNFHGGLIEHTYLMLKNAKLLFEQYSDNINKELLYAGCILHDIGKLKEYSANEFGIISDYTLKGELLGHITIMCQELAIYSYKLGLENDIDKDIITLLTHMILSHHGQLDFGSPKLPMIKEAELLHFLDILDTRMFMFDNVNNELEPGELSKRLWALDDRKILKIEMEE